MKLSRWIVRWFVNFGLLSIKSSITSWGIQRCCSWCSAKTFWSFMDQTRDWLNSKLISKSFASIRLRPFNRNRGSLSANRCHRNQRRFVSSFIVPSHGNFSTFSLVLIDRAACSKAISQWLPDHLRITSESVGKPISLSLYIHVVFNVNFGTSSDNDRLVHH